MIGFSIVKTQNLDLSRKSFTQKVRKQRNKTKKGKKTAIAKVYLVSLSISESWYEIKFIL